MKIVLAGGTGFIGGFLTRQLAEDGHDCTVLIRSHLSVPSLGFPSSVRLAPYGQMPDAADAVVNLAGETISGRWTRAKKERILKSRVETTRHLVNWMGGLAVKPSVFLSASAVGFYGDEPREVLTERSRSDGAKSFLSRVCVQWEQEADEARKLGVRVVNLRFGHVLSPEGGMLGRLMPMFRLSPFVVPYAPSAYVPWVSMRDLAGMTGLALGNGELGGPVNLVAPTATTSLAFHEELAKALGRQVFGSLPSFLLRLGLGEFGEALTWSQRVIPERMVALGYVFKDPDIASYFGSLKG